jgi:hypothetical protein
LRGPGRAPTDFLSRPISLLIFTAPFVALALLAERASYVSVVHREVAGAAEAAQAAGDPGGIGFAYPPITRLLALGFADTPGLPVLAALMAGGALWFVWRRLAARGTPWPLRLALVLAVGATPGYGYLMTQTLPRAAAILLLAIALDGFLRFTIDGETAGGFRAGLLLGLAFFFDFYAVLFALGLALAAVPFVRQRLEGPGLARATIAVLLFPTVAAAGIWAFVEWSQTGQAFGSLTDPHFSLAWFPDVADASSGLDGLRLTGEELLCAPVFVVSGILLARRVRIFAFAIVVPTLLLAAIRYVGAAYIPFSFITLGLIGCLALPAQLSRNEKVAVALACVAQLVLLWTIAPTLPGAEAWEDAIRTSF